MEITVWLQGLEPAHEPDELGFFFNASQLAAVTRSSKLPYVDKHSMIKLAAKCAYVCLCI